MNADDMATWLAKHEQTDSQTVDLWLSAIKGITASQVRAVIDSFGTTKGITIADFGRARRRMFPPPPCRECDDTGQIWDGSQYHFCTHCPRGDHMAQVNARIASESTALRPVWAAALPEQARRYEGNVVTLERLCGQCGTPLASHTEGDRKFCDTLAPKGAS